MHYVLAHDLWATDPNVTGLDGTRASWGWLFWQRPLFSLLMWPGASVSFMAYRVEHILVSSLIPFLAVLLARHLSVDRWFTGAMATLLIVHPALVTWNVLVLPDSLMLALFLGALLAAERGHPLASASLALAACWTKEVAVVGVAALLLLALWREPDGSRGRIYPLAIGRTGVLYFLVLLLAFLPLAYSLTLPWARFPGWDLGGDSGQVLERLFVVLWLAPVPLLAFLEPRTRRLAVVCLAWTAFFLIYHFVLGKALEIWYYLAPTTFALLAMAGGLQALWRRAPAGTGRLVPLGVTLVVALLLGAQVTVADNVPAKAAVITPITHGGQWSLAQALAYEHIRDQGLYDAMAQAPADPHGTWATIDTDWSFWAYPMLPHTGQVLVYFTENAHMDRDPALLAAAIESSNATILYKRDNALSHALQSAYADCVKVRSDPYVLILGQACKGRTDRITI
jgi:hypothetical protein